jgi:hypothetical protein
VVRVTVRCPVPNCGTDNDATADSCARCGIPVRNFARLSAYPAQLFNRALSAARSDDLGTARELFAAVVHWCPHDWEARNALALAHFQLGDTTQARHHWTLVLGQRPEDPFATAGLARLDPA